MERVVRRRSKRLSRGLQPLPLNTSAENRRTRSSRRSTRSSDNRQQSKENMENLSILKTSKVEGVRYDEKYGIWRTKYRSFSARKYGMDDARKLAEAVVVEHEFGVENVKKPHGSSDSMEELEKSEEESSESDDNSDSDESFLPGNLRRSTVLKSEKSDNVKTESVQVVPSDDRPRRKSFRNNKLLNLSPKSLKQDTINHEIHCTQTKTLITKSEYSSKFKGVLYNRKQKTWIAFGVSKTKGEFYKDFSVLKYGREGARVMAEGARLEWEAHVFDIDELDSEEPHHCITADLLNPASSSSNDSDIDERCSEDCGMDESRSEDCDAEEMVSEHREIDETRSNDSNLDSKSSRGTCYEVSYEQELERVSDLGNVGEVGDSMILHDSSMEDLVDHDEPIKLNRLDKPDARFDNNLYSGKLRPIRPGEGVHWDSKRQVWISRVIERGAPKSVRFPVSKFGFDGALQAAIKARAESLRRTFAEGALLAAESKDSSLADESGSS